MKPILLLLAIVFLGNGAFPQVPVLCKNLQHPESVITDGKFIYVADIGTAMEPSAKDGDGRILKFSLKGELLSANLAKTVLNAPKGMAIVNHTLYAADVDRIVGISLSDGKLVNEISFSSFKTLLVNDLVSTNDSTLYATATDVHKLFKVMIGKRNVVSPVNIPPLTGANGISYDRLSQRLYVVGLGLFTDKEPAGKIGYISLNKTIPEYTAIPAPKGFYDGIAILDDHTLLVSDWGSLEKPAGALYKIDVNTGRSTRLKLPRDIAGPADLWFDRTRNRVLIPEMLKGRILNIILNKPY